MSIEVIEIKESDEVGMDERYGMYYKCPNCQEENIALGYNYCPDCGIRLDWKD